MVVDGVKITSNCESYRLYISCICSKNSAASWLSKPDIVEQIAGLYLEVCLFVDHFR